MTKTRYSLAVCPETQHSGNELYSGKNASEYRLVCYVVHLSGFFLQVYKQATRQSEHTSSAHLSVVSHLHTFGFRVRRACVGRGRPAGGSRSASASVPGGRRPARRTICRTSAAPSGSGPPGSVTGEREPVCQPKYSSRSHGPRIHGHIDIATHGPMVLKDIGNGPWR